MEDLIVMCDDKRKAILRDMMQSTGDRDLVVVELGSYAGESAEAFLSSGVIKKLYCVDPWVDGYDAGDTAAFTAAAAERAFDARFAGDDRVVKVRGTIDDFIAQFGDTVRVDCAYIDACHTYKSTIRDILAVRYALRPRIFIAGHDYAEYWSGVRDAVNDVFGSPDSTYADSSWLVHTLDATRVAPVVDLGKAAVDPSVCVVIPVYRGLSGDEEESLGQCFSLLSRRHSIAFLCGDSFDPETIPEKYRNTARFERFPDRYFRGKHTYSRLLALPDFYSRFSRYTHILVYQLDGYVFRDDLLERWVKYDYVGAPWCYACRACGAEDLPGRVGNGGVSLRNVRKCHAVVSRFSSNPHPEDILVFNPDKNPGAAVLRIPGCHEALEFSLESGTSIAGYRITGKVPSFCHALRRWDRGLMDELKAKTRAGQEDVSR